ncbi:MAG: glycosyltransferase family 4 protein [Pirellulales bacterium]|nr:glycosyltransferase family 4 protein [Pirellulales bacterium]
MRIGLVIEQFDPRRGGVEQWTAQFAAALIERGHKVYVIARGFGPQTETMPIVRHMLDEVRCRVGFARAAEDAIRSLNLDIVHDTGCGWHCDIFQPHGGSRRVAARQNILLAPRWLQPIKRAVNSLLPRYRQFDALLKRQYANDGRTVLALSRRVAADLSEQHDVPDERIRLVYNGVDTQRFSPRHRTKSRNAIRTRLRISDDTLLLLIVAHNFRLKGVPMLLEAMAAWRYSRPAHLVVVGGKRPQRYRRAARRLGVGGSATFVGSVDDPVPYYAAADVYVHPTYYDPCSLVVLEALASGLPVVTSRENGVSELIEDGQEGFLLEDPGNSQEFLGQMVPLLDDNRRAVMGRAARRLARRHSFDKNVAEIIAIYEEIVQKRYRSTGGVPILSPEGTHIGATKPFICRRTGETVIDKAVSGRLAVDESSTSGGQSTPPSTSGAVR